MNDDTPNGDVLTGAEHDRLVDEMVELGDVRHALSDVQVTLDGLADTNGALTPEQVGQIREMQTIALNLLPEVEEELKATKAHLNDAAWSDTDGSERREDGR